MSRPLLEQAPPDATRRAVSAFRPRAAPSTIAVLVSIALVAFTWSRLWYFDQSLHVSSAGLAIARIVETVLAVATLTVPFYAIRAFVRMLRARRITHTEGAQPARMAMEDSRDDLWYVAGFGLMAFIVGFCAFLLTANGGAVRNVLFDFDLMWRSRTALLRGFWYNVKLFLVAQAIVLVWALLVAVVRQLPGRAFAPVRVLAIIYTDVFRGVPAIIVIYLIVLGFGLADVPPFNGLSRDSQLFWLSVLALVLVYGAYVAEVYRAGLDSIHWSQTAAARSLGLSQWQTLRHVVIPQAVRRILPPLLNDFVALQKDTALVSVVGVNEILNNAQLLKNKYFNLSTVTGAALFFLAITIPCTRFVDYLIKRDKRRTRAMTDFLELVAVRKRFGENEVLKGVDLNVAEHEVVCLIGPSGCGKSTLLRCINGLETIDGGEVHIDGARVSGRGVDVNALRQDVGIVFQSFNLFPHMTVMQNVTLAPRKVLRLSSDDANERANDLLFRIGLWDKRAEYPDRLSGGQQQRVAIVRALAMQPRVMLLDEITSALDPELVSEVLELVRELAREGMTMLIATHEMGFAREVANNVVFLWEGHIEERGTPDEIFGNPQRERTRTFLRSIVEAGRLEGGGLEGPGLDSDS